jgi:DNA-binding transcriptional regulator YhcF (GntR family)
MRMNDRTEPTDAIERLAWALNYHQGESISTNKLAKKTGLSWATTKKYVQLLEVLNRIEPDIEVNSDGIMVKKIGDNLGNLKTEKDIQLAIYILQHANIEGETDDTIDKERHAGVLEKYDNTIEELESIGWIATTDETIRITPEGAAIAGPAKSKYRNTDLKESITVPEITTATHSDFEEWEQGGDEFRYGTTTTESGTRSEYPETEYQRAKSAAATR